MEMKSPSPGNICHAVLMPHAPVLIPEVGGGREHDAAATVSALWKLSRNVLATRPDALVLISPHSPRRSGRFGVWSGESLMGDMGKFGRPDTRVELPHASDLTVLLDECLSGHGLATWNIGAKPLDHGALVPLYFLNR
jgi:aromatic ring-opening dioxygenase LigB subunit